MGYTVGFPKGSMVAIDYDYNDYACYKQWTEKEIFFVTRLKSNAKSRVVSRQPIQADKGLTSCQTIEFTAEEKPADNLTSIAAQSGRKIISDSALER